MAPFRLTLRLLQIVFNALSLLVLYSSAADQFSGYKHNSVYGGCKHYVIMTHTRDSNGMRSVVLRAVALRPELRPGFEKKQCMITLDPRTGYGLELRTRLTPFNGSQIIGDYLEILLENGAKKEFLMFVPQNNNGESVFITKCRLQIMYHFNTEKGVELKEDTALTITTFKEGFSQSLKDNNNSSSKCIDVILGWALVLIFTTIILLGAFCLYLQRQKLFFYVK